MNPDLSRYHRLVLFPVIGAVMVRRARAATSSQADRNELTAALRCQMAGVAVWALHLGMQLVIGFIAWMMYVSLPLSPDLMKFARTTLLVSTVANLVMWVAEWGLVVAAGLAASRGVPYPLTRRETRSAARAVAPDGPPPSEWKALNDG
jgi:hypothetical protein